MNDRTSCATPEALVTYLYEECEPAERESIAAHVAMCTSCAEEVQALGDTRAHLASWSPPALPLGFQLTRTESEQPEKVLRPAAWWKQPLPAWAQVAAAVVIFAAGMSVSAFRQPQERPARIAESPTPARVTAAAPASEFAVTRADFARLEARLRSIESADVQRASFTSTDPAVDDVTERVNALNERLSLSERQNQKLFLEIRDELKKTDQNITQRTASLDQSQRALEGAVRTVLRSGLAVPVALNAR